MTPESISNLIDSLTPQEQEAVRAFIEFLESKGHPGTSTFRAAVDEFIGQHPELLRRLVQ